MLPVLSLTSAAAVGGLFAAGTALRAASCTSRVGAGPCHLMQ